jgi:cell division protein YceG involved in septum cleavage
MGALQCFKILPDGTTEEIVTEGKVKDILLSDECYVIVSDDVRKVFLWKGINSSVRSKFIGAKRSQEIRGQVGLHYGVVPLDEGEEDNEFIQLIGGKTQGTIAKEIKAEPVKSKPTPSTVHPLREKNIFGSPEPAQGMNIAGSKERAALNAGPLYRGESSMADLMQDESQVDFQGVMKKLEEIQIPPGFERELIIIGNQAFSVVEKVQQFLGKKEVTKEISKVGSIPEGIFFAEDYSPRILSENGKIIAIEFLKRTGTPAKPVESKSKRDILKEQIKEQLGGT